MKRLASFFLLLALFSPMAYVGQVPTAFAGVGDKLKSSGSGFKELSDQVAQGDDGTQFLIIVANIINVILGFAGLILVFFLIYGGFLWATDQGDETQVKNAKHVLKNSIIGVVIVIIAFSISNFVISTLSTKVLNSTSVCVGNLCP